MLYGCVETGYCSRQWHTHRYVERWVQFAGIAAVELEAIGVCSRRYEAAAVVHYYAVGKERMLSAVALLENLTLDIILIAPLLCCVKALDKEYFPVVIGIGTRYGCN